MNPSAEAPGMITKPTVSRFQEMRQAVGSMVAIYNVSKLRQALKKLDADIAFRIALHILQQRVQTCRRIIEIVVESGIIEQHAQ